MTHTTIRDRPHLAPPRVDHAVRGRPTADVGVAAMQFGRAGHGASADGEFADMHHRIDAKAMSTHAWVLSCSFVFLIAAFGSTALPNPAKARHSLPRPPRSVRRNRWRAS
ncbi:hypothetical protein [Nocardia sp. NPDC052566]|uniref:hypothetical protein n=1 Tax=Nocardia sp. NPDC052566 TaxID=3364330 RepID=UPI0037CBD54E